MLEEKMVKSPNGVFKKHAKFASSPEKGNKAYRANDLQQSIVTVDNINFNADEKSMDRIDRVVEMANFQFNKALSQGKSATDAYESVYNRELIWKSADNIIHTVSVETLAAVQEKALMNMEEKWIQYG